MRRVNFSQKEAMEGLCVLIHYDVTWSMVVIFFLYYIVNNVASNLFKSFFIFMYIQKKYPITVWLHCCVTLYLQVRPEALMPFFFLNVVCIHRSVLPPAVHTHLSLLFLRDWKIQIWTLFLFFFFQQPSFVRWSHDNGDNKSILSLISHDHQSPTGNKRKRWGNTQKLINRTQDGPLCQDDIFFCFAMITPTLKIKKKIKKNHSNNKPS